MRVVMIGAPGSGKGTQGERLAKHLGMPHIASGDLLRDQVQARTELGLKVADCLDSGRLVPDELVLELVLPVVLAAAEAGGYVLDGFPRSVAQAVRAQERAVGPDRVIFLAVPEQVLVRRLLDRAAEAGRSDDTLAVITDRLHVFESDTRPVVEHYRAAGVLREVAADLSVDEVTEAVLAVL